MDSGYRTVKPSAKLQPFIRQLIIADFTEPVDVKISAPPSGYNYLGWLFAGKIRVSVNKNTADYSADAFVFGGQVQGHDVEMHYQGPVGIINAECTATGFYALTHIYGEQIFGAGAQVHSLDKSLALTVEDIVSAGSSARRSPEGLETRIRLFNEALEKLSETAAPVPDFISDIVERIERADGNVKIQDLTADLDFSPRHIDRQFKKVVGVTPKYFAKAQQANRAMRALLTEDNEYLADLAQASGYYDQSHFIKTIRQLFGRSPTEFLKSDDMLLEKFLSARR